MCKTKIHFLMVCCILLGLASCKKEQSDKQYLEVPVQAIETELKNLLHRFYPTLIDSVNGGYWTNFEQDWTRSQQQDKMLVTQARGLWTAAKAAQLFPEEPVFQQAADHGFRYLTTVMWDTVETGFHQNMPLIPDRPAHKMTYGNAFALYGLSEYAKINKSPEVLDWVKKAFTWMERVAHDSVHLGYYNLILPKSLQTGDTATQRYIRSLGWGNPRWKDQNTSIHVLEALTAARQVLPHDELVETRLLEMLHLVRDTMVHAGGYLHLYFTSDWKPILHHDSSRTFILDHIGYDHRSFGHDIETSYLLMDAAKAALGQCDPKTLEVAKKLADQSITYGFDKGFYGLFDKGYQFKESDTLEIVNRQKVWWAQAEAWHTLALMAKIFPEEKQYADGFRRMWGYIQNEMIDQEHKGWYAAGLDINPEAKTQRKANQWKGAYHDGRALMQVWLYANNRE